jgi:hypothetical protein
VSTATALGVYGWLCPRCDRVNAPTERSCQCSQAMQATSTNLRPLERRAGTSTVAVAGKTTLSCTRCGAYREHACMIADCPMPKAPTIR